MMMRVAEVDVVLHKWGSWQARLAEKMIKVNHASVGSLPWYSPKTPATGVAFTTSLRVRLQTILNLNVLSNEFLAEYQIHVGQHFEVDVATYQYGSEYLELVGGGAATAAVAALSLDAAAAAAGNANNLS